MVYSSEVRGLGDVLPLRYRGYAEHKVPGGPDGGHPAPVDGGTREREGDQGL